MKKIRKIIIVFIFVFVLLLVFYVLTPRIGVPTPSKVIPSIQFKSSLEKEFQRVRNAGFGSKLVYNQVIQFKSVSGLRRICFFGQPTMGQGDYCVKTAINNDQYGASAPIICDAAESREKTGQYVFIDGDITITGDIKINNIDVNGNRDNVDDDVLCIKPIESILCFSLENKGNHIYIDIAEC